MTIDPFEPPAVMPKLRDPITGETRAEMEVRWTRGPATVLHIEGHVEHLAERRIVVIDSWHETTLDGAPIGLTPAERFQRLTDELEAAEAEGL